MFRLVKLAILGALLACGTGCALFEKMKGGGNNDSAGPVPQGKQAPDLVEYLNRQASYVNSVRYNDLKIDVYAGKEHEMLNEGTLICAKPRSMMLDGGRHIMPGVVKIGSNSDEFWMYSKFPQPTFVYCSHQDFQNGAGNKLPFPFDPDWAMQALGMGSYRPDLQYRVELDVKNREQLLIFDDSTPQGANVRRTVVFAADTAGGGKPQIKRHIISDVNGETIAVAEVRTVETLKVGRDPGTAYSMKAGGMPAGDVYVQVPTRVVLDWPKQHFKMDLQLRNVKLNEQLTDEDKGRMFSRPTISGVEPINLAEARFSPSSMPRGATPDDLPPRRFGLR